MNPGRALTLLTWHFSRDLVLGGVATARCILSRQPARPGLARLDYGDLPEGATSVLGALVCLTPGTTTVEIDTARREILLHLLDTDQAEETLAGIRRDFLEPLAALTWRRP
jgi:multisubunit Na+/H+ antiporter MnhE subunit